MRRFERFETEFAIKAGEFGGLIFDSVTPFASGSAWLPLLLCRNLLALHQGTEPLFRAARVGPLLSGRGKIVVRRVDHRDSLFGSGDLVEGGPDPNRWRDRVNKAYRHQRLR